ncbi:spore coat protein GerQ [Gracilibacillus halotolerans]|uniref:Spore coat protein GerQ n=1 Tax=Gracilibacillus halotolerans TaxID=74386 RepID=A0A841RN66_9BACI|nr:spore coat protein GerQ [Gracilibacillus halotolerans]MBB6513063.1 spore coat protein GerQ [Gracilibacillus halotolerans]
MTQQGNFPHQSQMNFPMGTQQGFSQQGGMPQQQFPQPIPGQTPSGIPNFPSGIPGQQPVSDVPGMLPLEQSYIENILRLNRGKIATVYMTFENNDQWNAKIFRGIIEAAGRDHIILSDPETGQRVVLLMVYLDYITFDEEINYLNSTGNVTFNPR